MKAKLLLSREYVEFVAELKQRIVSARLSAARAVNRDLILLYWDIGRGIVERQKQFGWGKAVVESLAEGVSWNARIFCGERLGHAPIFQRIWKT